MALLRVMATIALALGLVLGGSRTASTMSMTDAQVRAGFLYNFATFVEWPPSADSTEPFFVYVLGNDEFASALTSINGRPANGRRLEVRSVDEADDLARAALLYIGLRDDRSAAAALARVTRASVLTVGESPRFAQIGGIIRLYTEESKLRFEINVERSQEVNLRISSKLLNLAKIVKAQ
jgi:hypothetical protein